MDKMTDRAKQLVIQVENSGLKWMREHATIIFFDILFGIIVYSMMLSGNLVNSVDGIWHTSHFIAGAWETSLGRGLLYFFDKLRSGLVSMPLNTILTIFFISISASLMLDIYSRREKGIKILISMFLIASPITGIILSHCYMSVDFSLALLFSVIAVWWIHSKYRLAGIFCGGVFIALSMGCYQAYFGITCLLILMLLMKKLSEFEEWKKIIQFTARSALTIVIGGVFYIIIANSLLIKYGIQLSSYRGASEVSLSKMIMSFPASVGRCYKYFYEYFMKHNMYLTVPRKSFLLLIGIGFFVLFCVLRLFVMIWRKNRIYAICFLGCVCLIPVASGAILLIVQGTDMILLMSMSLAVSPELCLLLCVSLMPEEGKLSFFTRKLNLLLLFLLIYVEVITVTNDQLALKEGKKATEGLTNAIVSELILEGYLEDDYAVSIVGRPSENSLFAKRPAWSAANAYAKFGSYWMGGREGYRTWKGFLIEGCGINLNFCTEEQYKNLLQTNELSEMPVFPAEGSIREIDGVVVVKVSDVY